MRRIPPRARRMPTRSLASPTIQSLPRSAPIAVTAQGPRVRPLDRAHDAGGTIRGDPRRRPRARPSMPGAGATFSSGRDAAVAGAQRAAADARWTATRHGRARAQDAWHGYPAGQREIGPAPGCGSSRRDEARSGAAAAPRCRAGTSGRRGGSGCPGPPRSAQRHNRRARSSSGAPSVSSMAGAVGSLPRSRFAAPSASGSQAPDRGTPRSAASGRPPSWIVASRPGSTTSRAIVSPGTAA